MPRPFAHTVLFSALTLSLIGVGCGSKSDAPKPDAPKPDGSAPVPGQPTPAQPTAAAPRAKQPPPDEPKYAEPSAETIEAYRKLGAEYGPFMQARSVTMFRPIQRGTLNGRLPAFKLREVPKAALPNVEVPFALELWRPFDKPQVTDADLKHLKGLENLTALRLDGTKVNGPGLQELAGLTKLTHLDLTSSMIPIAEVAKLKQVRSLNLNNYQGFGRDHGKLKEMPNLTAIVHGIQPLPPEFYETLGQMPRVTRLNFAGCFQLRQDDFRHLRGVRDLSHLDLSQTNANDSWLGPLSEFDQLDHLDLNNCQITDPELKFLRGSKLRWLQVAGPVTSYAAVGGLDELEHFECSAMVGVTPAHLEQLKPAKRLKHLRFYQIELSDGTMTALAGMPALRRLDLLFLPNQNPEPLKKLAALSDLEYLSVQQVEPSDDVMKSLTGLKKLKFLRAGGPKLTDAGVKEVGRLTDLTTLVLWGPGVTDAAVPHLLGLSNLKSLWLHNTGLTDAGVRQLAALKNLTHLDLPKGISGEVRKQLGDAIPGCDIHEGSFSFPHTLDKP